MGMHGTDAWIIEAGRNRMRRGDLPGAILQLKMAIASDPQSKLLRNALSEVMTEVGKKQ